MNFFSFSGAVPASLRRPLVVGLVNNAGPRARATIEAQFAALLRAASPGREIVLRRFVPPCASALPDGRDTGYEPLEALFAAEMLDALVVTGMEPLAGRAEDEPVWPSIRRIADWAEAYAIPVLWSCLAAHMAVLHRDGIARIRLAEKMSGLFFCEVTPHRLTEGAGGSLVSPHSRWHDLPEASLAAAGYTVLSRSREAGIDIFSRDGAAPALFLQGHPEYDADMLLREYRRDIRRAMRESAPWPPNLWPPNLWPPNLWPPDLWPPDLWAPDLWPHVPRHLFAADVAATLETMRAEVLAGRRDPASLAAAAGDSLTVAPARSADAARLVGNWLHRQPIGARAPAHSAGVGAA